SLAVEDQWYLTWPSVVWAGLRVTRGRLGRLTLLVVGAAMGSAVWAAVLWGNGDLSRIYYGTDTRAQELLMGAGLALLLAKVTFSPRLRWLFDATGVAALAALVAGAVLVHDTSPWLYRGGLLGTSLVVATVIVAGVQPGRGVVKATLSWPPFRWLGKISYGLYLWHWPVNIVLTSELTGLDSWALWGVRLEASLMLALASYFIVERPVLQMARFARPRVRRRVTHWSFGVTRAAVASGAMAVVAAMVVVVQSPTGPTSTPGGLPSEAAIGTTLSTMLASSPTGAAKFSSSAVRHTLDNTAPDDTAPDDTPEHLKVLITGDSVAFTLGFGFSPETVDPTLSVGVTAILGCGVVPGQPYVGGHPHPLSFRHCDGWEQIWRQGMNDSRPDVVVMLLGAWEVLDREVDGRLLRVGTPEYASYLEAQLTTAFDIVTANKTPVVLLTAPCYRETEARLGGPDSDRNDPVRGEWFNTIMLGVARRYGSLVKPIDFGAYLCPGGEPREQINGVTMRYDGVHFTSEGGAEVWRWLAPQVHRAVRTPFRSG
ncbi:MAG: acyltransferase family protein, partial [Actinobacteria bacterium]|nr:acyltransferase family protein [Actinomycetota bacterium]